MQNHPRERLQALVRTNNGFEIADMDLRLRGPGDLMGVQQSGLLELKIADVARDAHILQIAREAAKEIIKKDRSLDHPSHHEIKNQLAASRNSMWGNIG